MGALIGEAIIITNDALKADFSFHIKQRGAMLAKGSLLGIQFISLLENDLYLSLSSDANAMAKKLGAAILESGYELVSEIQSNQIFAIIPHENLRRLQTHFFFYEWEKRETDSLIRLVTSWATDAAQVDKFIHLLKENQ